MIWQPVSVHGQAYNDRAIASLDACLLGASGLGHLRDLDINTTTGAPSITVGPRIAQPAHIVSSMTGINGHLYGISRCGRNIMRFMPANPAQPCDVWVHVQHSGSWLVLHALNDPSSALAGRCIKALTSARCTDSSNQHQDYLIALVPQEAGGVSWGTADFLYTIRIDAQGNPAPGANWELLSHGNNTATEAICATKGLPTNRMYFLNGIGEFRRRAIICDEADLIDLAGYHRVSTPLTGNFVEILPVPPDSCANDLAYHDGYIYLARCGEVFRACLADLDQHAQVITVD